MHAVAIRVFEANTGDSTAFAEIAGVVKSTFGLRAMVMVGDRGMITSARIEALRELDEDYAWITALRAPAIKKLMADDGPLQLSLFDQQDLAEITSDDFPGERLIACRNLWPSSGNRTRSTTSPGPTGSTSSAPRAACSRARRRRRSRHLQDP